jgi:hypothetical protein
MSMQFVDILILLLGNCKFIPNPTKNCSIGDKKTTEEKTRENPQTSVGRN